MVEALSRLAMTEGWDRGLRRGRLPVPLQEPVVPEPVRGSAPTGPIGAAPGPGPDPAAAAAAAALAAESASRAAQRDEERLVLRDCLYALQGLDGERVRFAVPPDDEDGAMDGDWTPDAARDCPGVRIDLSGCLLEASPSSSFLLLSGGGGGRLLGSGAGDALRVCGEAGWLCRRVLAYIDGVRGGAVSGAVPPPAPDGAVGGVPGPGAVARALAAALADELSGHYRLVAVLEARLASQSRSQSLQSQGQGPPPAPLLTARRLLVHVRPATARLRDLAALVDSLPDPATGRAAGCGGGRLLAAILARAGGGSLGGTTRRAELLHSLAARAAEPWFGALWAWTAEGGLPADAALCRAGGGGGDGGTSPPPSSMRGREFFVTVDPAVPNDLMWHGRYVLHGDGVPLGIIGMDLARRALVLGKGVNFIRCCLGDPHWEIDLDDLSPAEGRSCSGGGLGGAEAGRRTDSDADADADADSGADAGPELELELELEPELDRKAGLGYRYRPSSSSSGAGGGGPRVGPGADPLDRTISRMEAQVNRHILSTLRERHHLETHLWALKQFLLFGRGDFILAMMDGLHRELEGRTADCRVGAGEMDGVYAHTLMSVVENALRTTNARFLPPYVLNRLGVGLATVDQRPPGEGGEDEDEARPDAWDAFHLTYEVDAPLAAVVHPAAARKYRRVFALLFRLKRIMYMLNRTWRQSTTLHHTLRQLALTYPDGNESARRRTMLLLRRVAMTRNSILHFVSNLQSYLMFEVMEGGYEEMARRVSRATTLDEVIAAHDTYLGEVVRKGLLEEEPEGRGEVEGASGGSVRERAPESVEGGRSLASELSNVLDGALAFCRVHSDLFEPALRSAAVATRKRRAAERRARAGRWGHDEVDRDVDGSNLLDGLGQEGHVLRVGEAADGFDRALGRLLRALDRTLNEGPGTAGEPWWRGGTGLDAAGFATAHGALDARSTPRGWSSDESLRSLAFRLDFNEYYNSRAEAAAG